MALSRSLARLADSSRRWAAAAAAGGSDLPRGVVPLRVLHHSSGVLVVHKPVGLIAQGGGEAEGIDVIFPRHATLDQHLDELAHRLGLKPEANTGTSATGEHGIRSMHRLDKDVEGPLVLALTAAKAKELGRQFRAHEVVKTYYALVSRYIPPNERPPTVPVGEELSAPVTTFTSVVNAGRSSSGRVSAHPGPATVRTRDSAPEFGVIVDSEASTNELSSTSGRETVYESQTAWAFIGGSPSLGLSLVRLHPISGRKHQLRVFCASTLRAPIVGDELYGFQAPAPHLALPADTTRLNRHGARGGNPPRPTVETPLFLKCISVSLTTHGPAGRPKRIVVWGADGPGPDEAGWPGVRPWLDDWVGEPKGLLVDCSLTETEAEAERARESRERLYILERRKRRKEAKKGKPKDKSSGNGDRSEIE